MTIGRPTVRLAFGTLPLVALTAVFGSVAAVAGWNLSGGRLLVMTTPSMCPAVCVGALVADRPLHGSVHVGELITFHPPDSPFETYTHEVARVLSDGSIQTRGIANPKPDPWLITRSDIVGRGVFTVWELGWVLKALPFLAVGVLFWVMARPWSGGWARRSWDRLWMTVLTVLPLWILHPLVRVSVISNDLEPGRDHLVRDTAVNVGILPVSVRVGIGPAVDVRPTDIGHVAGTLSANGNAMLREAVDLPWWGHLVVALVVIAPVAGYTWHSLRGDEVELEPEAVELRLDADVRRPTSDLIRPLRNVS